MLRAVLFDLGNVIVPIDFARCHEALSGLCPHPAREVPRIVGGSGLAKKYEQGLIGTPEFVRQTCELLSLEVSEEQFWELWGRIFLPDALIPESLLESLRSRYRLLLLSNTNPMHFELAQQRYPLLRHFHGYVLSYEVGALKPSPEIYREAIHQAGCRPEECFFADDTLANVEAAREAGMDAIQFLSCEQLQAEMRARALIE